MANETPDSIVLNEIVFDTNEIGNKCNKQNLTYINENLLYDKYESTEDNKKYVKYIENDDSIIIDNLIHKESNDVCQFYVQEIEVTTENQPFIDIENVCYENEKKMQTKEVINVSNAKKIKDTNILEDTSNNINKFTFIQDVANANQDISQNKTFINIKDLCNQIDKKKQPSEKEINFTNNNKTKINNIQTLVDVANSTKKCTSILDLVNLNQDVSQSTENQRFIDIEKLCDQNDKKRQANEEVITFPNNKKTKIKDTKILENVSNNSKECTLTKDILNVNQDVLQKNQAFIGTEIPEVICNNSKDCTFIKDIVSINNDLSHSIENQTFIDNEKLYDQNDKKRQANEVITFSNSKKTKINDTKILEDTISNNSKESTFTKDILNVNQDLLQKKQTFIGTEKLCNQIDKNRQANEETISVSDTKNTKINDTEILEVICNNSKESTFTKDIVSVNHDLSQTIENQIFIDIEKLYDQNDKKRQANEVITFPNSKKTKINDTKILEDTISNTKESTLIKEIVNVNQDILESPIELNSEEGNDQATLTKTQDHWDHPHMHQNLKNKEISNLVVKDCFITKNKHLFHLNIFLSSSTQDNITISCPQKLAMETLNSNYTDAQVNDTTELIPSLQSKEAITKEKITNEEVNCQIINKDIVISTGTKNTIKYSGKANNKKIIKMSKLSQITQLNVDINSGNQSNISVEQSGNQEKNKQYGFYLMPIKKKLLEDQNPLEKLFCSNLIPLVDLNRDTGFKFIRKIYKKEPFVGTTSKSDINNEDDANQIPVDNSQLLKNSSVQESAESKSINKQSSEKKSQNRTQLSVHASKSRGQNMNTEEKTEEKLIENSKYENPQNTSQLSTNGGESNTENGKTEEAPIENDVYENPQNTAQVSINAGESKTAHGKTEAPIENCVYENQQKAQLLINSCDSSTENGKTEDATKEILIENHKSKIEDGIIKKKTEETCIVNCAYKNVDAQTPLNSTFDTIINEGEDCQFSKEINTKDLDKNSSNQNDKECEDSQEILKENNSRKINKLVSKNKKVGKKNKKQVDLELARQLHTKLNRQEYKRGKKII